MPAAHTSMEGTRALSASVLKADCTLSESPTLHCTAQRNCPLVRADEEEEEVGVRGSVKRPKLWT